MRRIADFASLYQSVPFVWAVRSVAGCMAAALHFDPWVPNLVCRSLWATRTDAGGFPVQLTFEGGYRHPGDKPDWALSSG